MFNHPQCERCGNILQEKKLTEKEISEKAGQLIEQGSNMGGLAPKNEPYKNLGLLIFLLSVGYKYYECKKCAWFKFKKYR